MLNDNAKCILCKGINDYMFACAFEQHREKGVATPLPVALAIYDVPGLPPLNIIEDMSYEKNTRKSTRADIERQIQEEIAKSRVRQVDSQDQIGAIRLGMRRALQNWAPNQFRPPLKEVSCRGVSAEGSGVTVEGSATFPEEAIATPPIAETKAVADENDDSDVDLLVKRPKRKRRLLKIVQLQ